MTLLEAIVLGLVEGLTELLPVSSTGHLILLSRALGHGSEAAKALDIVIQLGAVVAVGVYFRRRLATLLSGLWHREASALRLTSALLCAFVPTAIAGLLLHRLVKARLFAPAPVAGALIAGGLLMVVVERWRARANIVGEEGLERVGAGRGLIIGLCQCLALWPGASRSMTTIVGGQLCGLSTQTAAEFSFLLALPTLGAATLYDLYLHGSLILAMPSGAMALGAGMVVSFAVAWLVVALFLKFLGRTGLTPFGIYRVLLGVLVLAWL